MVTHFDEKGKFYTPVINKRPQKVVIQTTLGRVQGKVFVRPEERLKDEMDRNELFLAVTDATIYNSEGQAVAVSKFLALNRNQIIWVMPDDEGIEKAENDNV